jgi:hypothetical protein
VTAQYTYTTCDFLTGIPLADLPCQADTLPQQLNTDASASGLYVQLDDRKLSRIDPDTATTPRRTSLFVLRNGRPVWGGIIWDRKYDSTTRQLELSCSTVESWYRHRGFHAAAASPFAQNQTWLMGMLIYGQFVAAEPANTSPAYSSGSIGRCPAVMTRIPSLAPSDPYGTATSGTLRAVTYATGKVALDAMVDLAQFTGGVDFTARPAFVNGRYGWSWKVGYPNRIYTPYATTGLRFSFGERGGNINSYVEDSSGATAGTSVVGIGSQVGGSVLTSVQHDTAALSSGWPMLDTVNSHQDARTLPVLAAFTAADLAAASPEATAITWSLLGDSDPEFGSYELGDEALFSGSDFRFRKRPDGSAGLARLERIVGWNLRPPTDQRPELVEPITNVTQPDATPRYPGTVANRLRAIERALVTAGLAPRT